MRRRFFGSFLQIFFAAVFFIFFGCASNSSSNISDSLSGKNSQEISKNQDEQNLSDENQNPKKELNLTMNFAGDIMAHNVNYKMGKFDRIWRDIKPLLSSSDLSFANIEAPVADALPWSTYPAFNMHSEYVEAAVNAGFNVFSLSNNHTNDQYLDGIKATRKYFSSFNSKNPNKEIWWAGLREKSFGDMTYTVIEKNGFKILFAAITEILNRPDYASYIDYYPATQKKRAELKENLKRIGEENPHDLMILSVHTDEAEYVREVTESHRIFFRELISECKADIIWANHPHITKIWETVELPGAKANGLKTAFIMYANGNTVSGQRTSPNFKKTQTERDDTGDGVIISVKMKKNGEKLTFEAIEPHFITTYITPSWQFVVKLLDDDFLHSLDRADVANWPDYLFNRREILEAVAGESKSEIYK